MEEVVFKTANRVYNEFGNIWPGFLQRKPEWGRKVQNMKMNMKRLTVVVLALVVAIGVGYFSWDRAL